MLIHEDRYNNYSIEGLKKGFPDEFEKLEETLKYHPRVLKTEFPEKWDYLSKKITALYVYISSINEFEKTC